MPAHAGGRRSRTCDINLKAAGLGLEPRYWASKAHVLPLDDPAALRSIFFNLSDNPFFFPATVFKLPLIKSRIIFKPKLLSID